jgi:hypothetical protein
VTLLPPSPLQPLPGGGFAQREDLLPFGGGAKVRRLLPWLRALPPGARVVCLSDEGSHTFLVLARLLAGGAHPLRALLFLERAVPRTPYRAAVRAEYLADPRVRTLRGATAALWLRSRAMGMLPGRARWSRLGTGGTTGGDGAPHATAFRACAEQLSALGVEGLVAHVLPAASGETARGFLRAMDGGVPGRHRLELVATGPAIARRRLLRLLGGDPRIALRAASAVPVDRSLPLPLDPVHGLPTAGAFAEVRRRGETAVLWVTSPRPPA